MALIPRCGHCGSSKEPLLRCSRCKVMLYCSREHQTSHRKKHKLPCNTVQQKRDCLQSEEEALRAPPPNDSITPADVFETQVGHFWDLVSTQDYMKALYRVIEALGKIATLDATQAALDHALDLLRLNRRDNMTIRNLIPAFFLRLGRDQDCYDFVKWWYQAKVQEIDYDWGDTSLPFLHIRNANALESVEYMCRYPPYLSNVVAITLLKIKLLLDVKSLKNSSALTDQLPIEIIENIQRYIPESTIISSNRTTIYHSDHDSLIATLSSQVDLLFTTINDANQYFWPALLNPEDHLDARPESWTFNSQEEMQLNLQYSINAWLETPAALEIIKAKVERSIVRRKSFTANEIDQVLEEREFCSK